jgi:hypothetical protein
MIRCFLRDAARMGGCIFLFLFLGGGMACGVRV